jgi:hypothetical protein
MQLCQQKRCTLMGVWWASLACLVLAAGVPEVSTRSRASRGSSVMGRHDERSVLRV